MQLSRHPTAMGPRWALDGELLPADFTLSGLLKTRASALFDVVRGLRREGPAPAALLSPIEPEQEVWASGVTYLRSREAREAESKDASVYERVYSAARPELFFKASGWRVIGPGSAVHLRADSHWNVPEAELTLVTTAYGEIVGYTAGNDLSSRDIEGENPLYLPQAKIFDGSCALGSRLVLTSAETLIDLPITCQVLRRGAAVFSGQTRSSQIKRPLTELTAYLHKELAFPDGVFLMTGTGIVPPDAFTLHPEDVIRIEVGCVTLENTVETLPAEPPRGAST